MKKRTPKTPPELPAWHHELVARLSEIAPINLDDFAILFIKLQAGALIMVRRLPDDKIEIFEGE